MSTNQVKEIDYDSIEYDERIANMINEGGLGVSAHYHYYEMQQQDSNVKTEN
ncbi:hypothetical protein [Oceanobacillus chungangensis]|uniref:hypothetical protein n=1 Tax=Oceanobacillus chungangensis TaxID=1229152 RepID=UPI001472FE96|nr:hypothetical protein [Oceanobacillus chungangensis]